MALCSRKYTAGLPESYDSAQALAATEGRNFFLSRLRLNVDALSQLYSSLRSRNDRWNQLIMVVSSIGALVTSILTISNLTMWPYEIIPIVIQTFSGVMAAWVRFYDYPKRMELIINAKHATNDTRERLEKSAVIDEELWELYCIATKTLDAVMTPDERDSSLVLALKYMQRERLREAQLGILLNMSDADLINQKKLKKLRIGTVDSNSSNVNSDDSPLDMTASRPPPPSTCGDVVEKADEFPSSAPEQVMEQFKAAALISNEGKSDTADSETGIHVGLNESYEDNSSDGSNGRTQINLV
jgi:hypothetical protein